MTGYTFTPPEHILKLENLQDRYRDYHARLGSLESSNRVNSKTIREVRDGVETIAANAIGDLIDAIKYRRDPDYIQAAIGEAEIGYFWVIEYGSSNNKLGRLTDA